MKNRQAQKTYNIGNAITILGNLAMIASAGMLVLIFTKASVLAGLMTSSFLVPAFIGGLFTSGFGQGLKCLGEILQSLENNKT